MKLHIYPQAIFRTPKFSYQSDLTTHWDELKKAISVSSSTFYQNIKDISADELNTLPPKILFTIWKYFNRAKYRSTPYGTFASFSLLNGALKSGGDGVVIKEEQKVHEFIDWTYKNNIRPVFNDLLESNCLIFSNSSYYLTMESIRYIACSDGIFELAEIDQDVFIVKVLETCLKPISIQNLIQKLGLEDETAPLFGLLEDMHALQLVFTDHDPNIIGKDYFERMGIKSNIDLPKYLIAERSIKSGALDSRLMQSIPGLINFLHGILPANEREAFKKFVDRFKRKFEGREVPLLLALDPEIGVGYDELEQAGENDDFVVQFNTKTAKEKRNDVKSILKQALSMPRFEPDKTIFLDKLLFEAIEQRVPLPNTFSMLFSVADDLVFIDQIGGITANALSGRFTLANVEVESYCRAIAKIEQEANPEIIFFDVAYMIEGNTDNINRRKMIYDHQLTLHNFDESDNPLSLNDILISVQEGQIVLRSKKLNKRMVPKMASAYNYIRSDLSVFRLLCDLQYQGIQSSLSLQLDAMFPDLEYYPRLQYQNIVLNTAKWQIKKIDFFKSRGESLTVDECRAHLVDLGVSRYFKAGLSDQTLCFDVCNDEDLNAFIQFMQKQKSIYLEEVIVPERSIVIDEYAQPYLAQFVLNIYHNEQIYHNWNIETENNPEKVKSLFLPGKEWLYFEIFCHQQRSDEILNAVIAQFLEVYEKDIKLWFFIRYNENGNHLRFRLLLNDEKKNQRLTVAFSAYLEPYLLGGLVSDLQIKTYKREIERYSRDLIQQVEAHFSLDSCFVLSLLENPLSDFDKYKICADVVEQIQKSTVFEAKTLTILIKHLSDAFNNEHQLDSNDFKKLNNQYQLHRKAEILLLGDEQKDKFLRFSLSFVDLLKHCNPTKKVKMFSDLMHMHVNRLFNKDQRTHEMVMYYFLLKDMQRRNAMVN